MYVQVDVNYRFVRVGEFLLVWRVCAHAERAQIGWSRGVTVIASWHSLIKETSFKWTRMLFIKAPLLITNMPGPVSEEEMDSYNKKARSL